METESDNNFGDSIKILEENPKIKPLMVLGESIFHAQTKSFQQRNEYSIFNLPLIFSPNLESQLNQYFDFQKTVKQFDLSLKQHKYILQKYLDLNLKNSLKQRIFEEFKDKITTSSVQNIFKKYIHSGGFERRKNIIEQLNFNVETTLIFDQYFFNNPFLSALEVNNALSTLETIEQKAKLNTLNNFKNNILHKSTKFINGLIDETGLSLDGIYKLNTYFNPRLYLLKDATKWKNIENAEADFELLYKAMVVVIIFYKVRIDETTHQILLNKLNTYISQIKNQIVENQDEEIFLTAKMNNLETLTRLFANLYGLLPTLDLKTRSLVREISIQVDPNQGLLTWENVLNTPFYNGILV
jgi:hypothetical protein